MLRTKRITRQLALELAGQLSRRGAPVTVRQIRSWPVSRVRDAQLWVRIFDATACSEGGFDVPPLGDFLAARESMRRCRICGCTQDNACLDRAARPCSWSAPGLCSACSAQDGPRSACLNSALPGPGRDG